MIYSSTALAIISAAVKFIVLFLSSFLLWRKLKEDYSNEQILALATVLLIFGYLGGRFFSLLGVFLGALGALTIFSRLNRLNWWQVADALVFPLFSVFLIFSLIDLFRGTFWPSLALVILSLMIIVGGIKIEKKYRSFSWYKSGKIGFLACSSFAAFFGLFLLLEIIMKKTLYWQMLIELGIVFGALILLYIRSERDFQQDKKSLLKKFRKNG